MCIPLFTQPTQTIKKDPASLPVPPAQPDPIKPTPVLLGSGAAANAARDLKDRKRKLDAQIEAATQ